MAEQPKKIGRFPIIDTLGVGGMGVVYLAKDPDIGRKVAIKVLHSTGEKDALERFKNEAKTMGEISHPNIVILLEYGIEDNKPFLVMEYLPGLCLRDWIKQPHTLNEHKKILIQLCDAVTFAHNKGILHRDLKPDNLQILTNGDAKLLDFGIATGQDKGLTATGFFIGTPKYLAPEILEDTTHTKTSDCYSLGLLAYTMFTGNNPFAAETFEASMTRILTKIPVSLNKINKKIPEELSNVIDSYLQKDPAKRPQTPQNLKIALELVTKPSVLSNKIILNDDLKNLRSQEKTVLAQGFEKKKNNWIFLALFTTVVLAFGLAYKVYLDNQKTQELKLEESVEKQPLVITKKPVQKEPDAIKILDKKEELSKIDKNKNNSTNNTATNKSEIKNDEKIGKQNPEDQPTQLKPLSKPKNKPITKVVKKPIKKQEVIEEEYKPPVIVYQKPKKKVDNKPIFKLPNLIPNSKKLELKTRSDTQISRGTTKSITVEIPKNITIDNFKVMRGLSEFNQVEIRKIKNLQKQLIKITLYAQSNAPMGDFSLVGYYQNKKTKPLIMEVTL